MKKSTILFDLTGLETDHPEARRTELQEIPRQGEQIVTNHESKSDPRATGCYVWTVVQVSHHVELNFPGSSVVIHARLARATKLQ